MQFRWTNLFRSQAYRRGSPQERLLIEIRFSIARTLRAKRKQARVTQAQLAQRLGAAPATISRVERASPHVAIEIFVRAMIELGVDSAEIAAAFDADSRTDVQQLRRRAFPKPHRTKRMNIRTALPVIIAAFVTLAAPLHAQEAVSLLGKPLHTPAPTPRLESDLANAKAAYAADSSADNLIWVGRRLAYLGRYREAIATFTTGIAKHPGDARFYRHRGHRHITVREFDNAIRDLEKAAELVQGKPIEIEPDGAPNKWNVPTSTLQSNTWYHLALAHYLKHDFARALPAWREAVKISGNDDMKVASVDWLYMTLRRMGKKAEAERLLKPIHANMRILENDAYHRRLLMYKGEIAPEELIGEGDDPVQIATYGYGVGNWFLYNGQRSKALTIFNRLVRSSNWAPFGVIAAEAELLRTR